MRAKELIQEIQKLIEEHGDVEVFVSDSEYGPDEISIVEYSPETHPLCITTYPPAFKRYLPNRIVLV